MLLGDVVKLLKCRRSCSDKGADDEEIEDTDEKIEKENHAFKEMIESIDVDRKKRYNHSQQ